MKQLVHQVQDVHVPSPNKNHPMFIKHGMVLLGHLTPVYVWTLLIFCSWHRFTNKQDCSGCCQSNDEVYILQHLSLQLCFSCCPWCWSSSKYDRHTFFIIKICFNFQHLKLFASLINHQNYEPEQYHQSNGTFIHITQIDKLQI